MSAAPRGAPDAAPIAELRGLSVAFDGQAALRGVDLAVASGEAVGMVGEAGCGKSVTWLAALGLLPAREVLVAAFGATPPRFVASGLIHQWRDHAPDGLRQIWAPPVSFIVGEDRQPSLGSKLIGLVEHVLHEDGTHDSRLLLPERLALNDLSRLPQLYARPAAAA